MKSHYELDITKDSCPITFVRTKIQLEKMSSGELLAVTLKDGEPMINVPRAVSDYGHTIIESREKSPGIYRLVIEVK